MAISLLFRVLYSILSLVVNIPFTSPSTFFIVFDNVPINVSKLILLGLNNSIYSFWLFFIISDIILNNSQRALLQAKAYKLIERLELGADELRSQSDLPFGFDASTAPLTAYHYESNKLKLDRLNRVLNDLLDHDNQYVQQEMSDFFEW